MSMKFQLNGSTLWNNRVITSGNKLIFIKKWFYFSASAEKHGVRCTYKDFTKIIRMITVSLIQLIRNTQLYSDVTTSLQL